MHGVLSRCSCKIVRNAPVVLPRTSAAFEPSGVRNAAGRVGLLGQSSDRVQKAASSCCFDLRACLVATTSASSSRILRRRHLLHRGSLFSIDACASTAYGGHGMRMPSCASMLIRYPQKLIVVSRGGCKTAFGRAWLRAGTHLNLSLAALLTRASDSAACSHKNPSLSLAH